MKEVGVGLIEGGSSREEFVESVYNKKKPPISYVRNHIGTSRKQGTATTSLCYSLLSLLQFCIGNITIRGEHEKFIVTERRRVYIYIM